MRILSRCSSRLLGWGSIHPLMTRMQCINASKSSSSNSSKCSRTRRLNWRRRLHCTTTRSSSNAYHSGFLFCSRKIIIDCLGSSIWILMSGSKNLSSSTSTSKVPSRVPKRTGRLMWRGSQSKRKTWVKERRRVARKSKMQKMKSKMSRNWMIIP